MTIEGKTALTTGSAGGQGAAAAELFSCAGATRRVRHPADQGDAQVDLTGEDAVREWVEAAADEQGRVDILSARLSGSTTNARIAHTVTKGGAWR
jgi:NAD(P)-dependent dehydrogenase (short-subunit alcohol dehydrogenase family)